MKRLLIIFGLLLCAASAAAQTTTFNGVVKDLTNTPVPTGQVTFQLKPGIDTTISGSSRFVPATTFCEIHNPSVVSTSGTGTITVVVGTAQTWQVGDSLIFVGTGDATLNASSVASPYTITAVNSTTSFNFTQAGTHTNGAGGTVGGLYKSGGTGACAVMQNTAITPANTSYTVSIQAIFSPSSSFNTYAIGSGPVDISTVVPTPSQLPAYSFVDAFSNQTILGIKTIGGTLFGSGGSFGGTFGGNYTHTGNRTDTGNNIHSGDEKSTGTMECKNFENIRCADQFAGADWIAKVNAASADLAGPGTIFISSSLAGSTAATALSILPGQALWFDAGTFSTSVCPNIVNKPGINLVGVPGGTIFSCVPGGATTAVFTIDGTGGLAGVVPANASGIIFSGNANTSFGLLLKAIDGGVFTALRAKNVTTSCFGLQGSLVNTFNTPTCSTNVDTMTTIPTSGMSFDILSAISSNANTINTPRFEGLTAGAGILCINGNTNTFISGTSEGNQRGANIQGPCKETIFQNVDFESNSTEDVLFNGTHLVIEGGVYNSTNKLHVGATGLGVYIQGNDFIRPISGFTVDAGGGGVYFMGDSADWAFVATSAKVVMDTTQQALGGKTLVSPLINTGITNSGTGFKHGRVTTGSFAAGARSDVTLTWAGTAFADTNYTVTGCVVVDTSGSGTGLRFERVRIQNTGSIVAQVINDSGVALTGTLHCSAVHD